MNERKSTLEEQIARATTELDARRGPGPFDCRFCGIRTKHPCVLQNCMECQNFGYYPPKSEGGGREPNLTGGGAALPATAQLIEAADKHADNYEGQDIPARDVRAAITNAFYAGSKFAASVVPSVLPPMSEE